MARIYIDMDGVLCNYAKAFNEKRAIDPAQPFPPSQFGFWMDLEPIDGAIDALNVLEEVFDVWVLSKPSFDNLNSFSEKAYWVNRYFGPGMLRKLILCGNKSLLIGDYLIDDTTTANQTEFQGKFIHFGTEMFPNWIKVLQYFAIYV